MIFCDPGLSVLKLHLANINNGVQQGKTGFVDAPIFALCTSVIILHVELVATVANVPKGFV